MLTSPEAVGAVLVAMLLVEGTGALVVDVDTPSVLLEGVIGLGLEGASLVNRGGIRADGVGGTGLAS